MSFFPLLGLCVLSYAQAAAGLHSSADPLLMVALKGDAVTLPCGLPSTTSCSSINWNQDGEFGSVTEVVKTGSVTEENVLRLELMKDCSLKIKNMALSDARLYTCDSGTFNTSVSLQILDLVTMGKDSEKGTMELQCFLNIFRGHIACNNNTGFHIKWTAEDDSPIKGNRYTFQNPSVCFSKLIIAEKPTDHHRKWKCQLTQHNVPKASISYTSTVQDGLEEVFASAGESVPLLCTTSFIDVSGSMEWTVCEKPPTDRASPTCGQMKALQINKDPSFLISKLQALHAGDYQCSETAGQQRILHKIRLHVLNVAEESGPGGDNITLTCVLTCAAECETDFNLTWSPSSHNALQSALVNVNNTLTKKLFLPVGSPVTGEISCSVHKEGVLMVFKKWRLHHPPRTPVMCGLLLGLMIIIAAGGFYVCITKRHKKEAANEPSGMDMTHVYDVIQDVNHEEQQQRQFQREAVNTTDSFYDLLQAVN